MDNGKENAEPRQQIGLARMFHEGNMAIGTHKTDNLFKQLESRSLTEQEEAIIQQRTELQRKMLLAYEAREKTRKVQDLLQVCPDLTEEEAQRALDLCRGSEDDAAAQVSSDPAFRRRLQIATTSASTHQPAETASRATKRANKWHAKPSAKRPKQVDQAALGNSVFVGSFRGGKRGGSRTAHLKGAAGNSPQPCSTRPNLASKVPTTGPSSFSRAAARSSRQSAAPQDSLHDESDSSDAVISDSSDEEGSAQEQLAEQVPISEDQQEEEEEELKFEVDVVDTLGSLSQAATRGQDDPHQPNVIMEAAAASASRSGVRQSRRLAALANDGNGISDAGQQPSKGRQTRSAKVTEQPSSAVAAADASASGKSQQPAPTLSLTQPRSTRSTAAGSSQDAAAVQEPGNTVLKSTLAGAKQSQASPQLSQAVLEASANVLRDLTQPTAITFLKKMEPGPRHGTWMALQAMDPLKAQQLQNALHSAGEAALLCELRHITRNIAAPQAVSNAVGAAMVQESGQAEPRRDQTEARHSAVLPPRMVALPQLSQSVLEASANVLRTLTLPTAINFLKKMDAGPRQGTWKALQAMDFVKAQELEAAVRCAKETALQQELHSLSNTAPLPHPDAAEGPLPIQATAPGPHVESAEAVLPDQAATRQSDPTSAEAVLPIRASLKSRLKLPKQAVKQQGSALPAQDSDAASDSAREASRQLKAELDVMPAKPCSRAEVPSTDQSGVVQSNMAAAHLHADAIASGHKVSPSSQALQQADVRTDGVTPEVGNDQTAPSSSKAGAAACKSKEHMAMIDASPDADVIKVEPKPSSSKPASATGKRAWQSKKSVGRKGQQVSLQRAFAKQSNASEPRKGAEPQQERRSTRARATPAHIVESAAVSDVDTEAETESDTDFTAGAQKRGRGAKQISSPVKKRKTGSPDQVAPPSPGSGQGKSRAGAPALGADGTKRKRASALEGPPSSPKASASPPNSPGAVRRSPRVVKKSQRALEGEAMEAEPASAPQAKAASGSMRKGSRPSGGNCAIARSGHTNRGRVKQKSHKSAEILHLGSVRSEKGWYNSGYIFPEGFKSQLPFRSSVDIDQLVFHECTIIGRGGAFWPQPTYKVVAMDRPDEPLIGKSCTSCWTQVLKRINSEIEARRKAGEALPPPPKTAIAGPEYFGLNQPELAEQIEALDPEQQCFEYWQGKADREAAAAGLPPAERAPRPQRASGGSAVPPKAKRSRRNRQGSDEEGERPNEEDEGDEASMMTNRWSAVSRTERYRKRCGDEGSAAVDESNPLPDFIDPITLDPVVTPAISPWGHVMGLATWKAVLAEQGKCPFTKKDLSWEQCTTLSLSNIERYRDRIK